MPGRIIRKDLWQRTIRLLVRVFGKLRREGQIFFPGGRPFILFRSRNNNIEVNSLGRITKQQGDPCELLRKILSRFRQIHRGTVFSGGAIGYIAYDAVRLFEDIPDSNPDTLKVNDLDFMFPSEIIIFDHKENMVDIIVYNGDDIRIEKLIEKVYGAREVAARLCRRQAIEYNSEFSKNDFCEIVERSKEHIRAGDIFQVVLSRRFDFCIEKEPISIYKALRITNPSPYMYYLRLNDLFILGSSPETLVQVVGGKVISRPLAGTRPRGDSVESDRRRESELLKDEKEIAEHVMLVDLARNDLGRVCEYGSVRVTELLKVERYSKVMHIVSNVVGRLAKGYDGFDVLAATFPAGTVSGAPKIRAMEIIDELEPVRRGVYGGAIGYFGFKGNMDLCIAIRTIVMKKGKGYIQGGAGIVVDSIPEREYVEMLNKTSALKKAVEIAG